MSNDKTTAVFGDLTALYATRSRLRKTINYKRLDEVLRETMQVDKWDVNAWYTLFADNNDGQVSFVEGLRELGWDVETLSSREVRRVSRPTDYRFDARIAYQLGACQGEVDNVLVVSDSFELMHAIRDLQEDDTEINVSLAFFSDAIDGRWWKVINDPKSPIKFIDLEDKLYD